VDDPDDLIFLDCADKAAADYLVTANRKHYPASGENPHRNRRLSDLSPQGYVVADI
jgi:predicted nucleic acid-binding protein